MWLKPKNPASEASGAGSGVRRRQIYADD